MIKNTRTNQTLARKVICANRVWSRVIGLMGKKELTCGHALYIYPCKQIHTFFMRFSIDCLFIDKDHRVVRLLEQIEPWKISPAVDKAYGVIELPSGTIRKSDTRQFDTLEIVLQGEKAG